MSRKNRLNYQTLKNGDMSLSAVLSSVTSLQYLDNVGFQINWTGTSPVGSLTIEISADYQQDFMGNVTNSGNWVTASTLTTAVSGNAGSIYLDANQLSAPYVRVRYTKTSGTGTINVFINAKMI